MEKNEYVHGYSKTEACRLYDQANTLSEILHHDTIYPPGSMVLESGCGTGAQTVILAENNPEVHFVSIDISRRSLDEAKALTEDKNIHNVRFQTGDIFDLPFKEDIFDHIFVCFVLEHLSKPMEALLRLKKVLKKNGTITVVEGDHGSWYCYPQSKEASMTVQCLIDVQAYLGGNSLIGRQIFPLLMKAGFSDIHVSPRIIYVDSSKPELVEGFSKKTFIAMVEGVKEQALALCLIDEKTWDKGISDLYRATATDGTFSYTFYKGVGIK